jgi:hypothetical protein
MLEVRISGDQFLGAENISATFRLPDHLQRQQFAGGG